MTNSVGNILCVDGAAVGLGFSKTGSHKTVDLSCRAIGVKAKNSSPSLSSPDKNNDLPFLISSTIINGRKSPPPPCPSIHASCSLQMSHSVLSCNGTSIFSAVVKRGWMMKTFPPLTARASPPHCNV